MHRSFRPAAKEGVLYETIRNKDEEIDKLKKEVQMLTCRVEELQSIRFDSSSSSEDTYEDMMSLQNEEVTQEGIPQSDQYAPEDSDGVMETLNSTINSMKCSKFITS